MTYHVPQMHSDIFLKEGDSDQEHEPELTKSEVE